MKEYCFNRNEEEIEDPTKGKQVKKIISVLWLLYIKYIKLSI